jgi:hypothetical protein
MSNDYDYEMEVFLDPDAVGNSTDAARRTGDPLEHQVEAFQRERGEAVTGSVDDAAEPLTQCHDECKPPLRD